MHWWIVLYADATGERHERQVPATDQRDAWRYVLANLPAEQMASGVTRLSVTRFGATVSAEFVTG